jgi:hypothetical protein
MLNMWHDTFNFRSTLHSEKLYWRRMVFSRAQDWSVKICKHSWNFGDQEGDYPAYYWHLCWYIDAKSYRNIYKVAYPRILSITDIKHYMRRMWLCQTQRKCMLIATLPSVLLAKLVYDSRVVSGLLYEQPSYCQWRFKAETYNTTLLYIYLKCNPRFNFKNGGGRDERRRIIIWTASF